MMKLTLRLKSICSSVPNFFFKVLSRRKRGAKTRDKSLSRRDKMCSLNISHYAI